MAGPGQVDGVREALERRGVDGRYRLFGYLDNFPEAVAAADLVVARSGGSVFELAAVGRPAVLVPYPHATGDHQAKNARWLAEAGGAVVLPDAECTGHALRGVVGALLADRPRLAAMAEASRAAGRPEAAGVIADAVLELAAPGSRRRRRRPPRRRRGRTGSG